MMLGQWFGKCPMHLGRELGSAVLTGGIVAVMMRAEPPARFHPERLGWKWKHAQFAGMARWVLRTNWVFSVFPLMVIAIRLRAFSANRVTSSRRNFVSRHSRQADSLRLRRYNSTASET